MPVNERVSVQTQRRAHPGVNGVWIEHPRRELAEHDAFDFQLRVYADAGRGEGLDVASAFVHDLKHGDRRAVDVSAAQVDATRTVVQDAVAGMRAQRYDAKPGSICGRCDVAAICPAAPRRRNGIH